MLFIYCEWRKINTFTFFLFYFLLSNLFFSPGYIERKPTEAGKKETKIMATIYSR